MQFLYIGKNKLGNIEKNPVCYSNKTHKISGIAITKE